MQAGMAASPATAASVALVRGDQVLLIRRAFAPFAGLWTLPGGRCEPGEDAREAAIREVREELGLAVAQLWPVTELAVAKWRLAVFSTTAFTGDVLVSPEVADWRWATLADASQLPTTPELADVLALALRGPQSSP